MLEKPKLFLTLKEFVFSMVLLLFVIVLRLFFLHQEYREFIAKPFYYVDVEVLQAYEKSNEKGRYNVLKVYAPSLELSFFTTTQHALETLGTQLRLKLFPTSILSFRGYLGTGYIFSQINQIYEPKRDFKASLLNLVEAQHDEEIIRSFYKAIYFATPLDRDLREQVSALGVSHLMALSGFHLAILSSILYFLLRPLYRVFQSRYFPHRYDLQDLGLLVLLLLAFYVWFVGMPPSLLRSYAMMFLLWVLLVLGIELLSFSFLLTITLSLIAIFPPLLLSLAFWFSVAGVFYIFLLIKYFSHLNKYLLTLLINFLIFILMLPIIHMIFPLVTTLQLLSPLLSLIFTIFYPLSMLLHLFGMGGLLDSLLMQLFTLESSKESFELLALYGVSYIFLSLLAIHNKMFFYFLLMGAMVFSIGLFTGFWV